MTKGQILQLLGAGGFGAIVGWYVYYINRYRSGDVQFSDLTTVLGTIGGAAVLALFPASTDLFGAYGIGLFIGFFGYFIVLMGLVGKSENFDADWFLDGRRKKPIDPYEIPGSIQQPPRPPMAVQPPAAPAVIFYGAHPAQGMYPSAAPAPAMLPMALPNPTAARIIQTCKDVYPTKKDACNFFAIEVASRFGVTLSGVADSIADQIKGTGWTQHGTDGVAAANAARDGKLVVAALKGPDNVPPAGEGHVVIVTDGPLAHSKYPTGYWGSTNPDVREKGDDGTTVNWCWNTNSRDKVIYSSRAV